MCVCVCVCGGVRGVKSEKEIRRRRSEGEKGVNEMRKK